MDLRTLYIWVWAALCIAAFAYYAVDAHANHAGQPVDDAATQRYIQNAYSFYFRHGEPHPECSHVVAGTPPEPYEHNGVAWGDQPGCNIWVSPAVYPYSGHDGAARYCGAIMHEVGHNLGFGHTFGRKGWPMDVQDPFTHPNCYAPFHVVHRHRHVHRKCHRTHGHRACRTRVHWHKHYHLKVGQPSEPYEPNVVDF